MASEVEQSTDYPCSAATLHATLTDESYWRDRAVQIGIGGRVVDFTTVNDEVTSVVEQGIESSVLPKALQRIAGAHLTALCTESWTPLGDDGARGHYSLAVTKMPVTVEGDLRLIATGDRSCTLRFRGTVTASIPAMGPMVEKVMVAEVDRGFDTEREYTMSWLASRSALPSE